MATAIDRITLPYVFKIIIDKIESFTGDKTQIMTVIGGHGLLAASIIIFVEICYRSKGIIYAYVMPKFQANIRLQILQIVQNYAINHFQRESTGSAADKINDLPESAKEVMTHIIEICIPTLLCVLLSVVMLCTVDAFIVSLFTLWLTVHGLITFYGAKKCMIYSQAHSQACNRVQGLVVDNLRNIYNMKLFSHQKLEDNNMQQHQSVETSTNFRNYMYGEKLRIVLGIIATTEYISILYIAVLRWQKSIISLGDLVYITNVTTNMAALIWFLSIEMPFLFEHLGICRQSLSIIDDPTIIEDSPNAITLKNAQGRVEFDNVSFGHTETDTLLRDINLVIPPKSKIGITGATGSGKSSFINLILRIHDVTSGSIKIDGIDIREITHASLVQNIMLIPQRPVMFNRTILENLSYANPELSAEEIMQVCKKMHCHEFIMNLNYGYDTVIGEGCKNLSGGQNQLLAIARAMLKNAPILIMDEFTAALDGVTEQQINQSVSELIKDRTIISVTHKISTLKQMDKILVFENGQIVENGTHDQLIHNGGHYESLYKASA